MNSIVKDFIIVLFHQWQDDVRRITKRRERCNAETEDLKGKIGESKEVRTFEIVERAVWVYMECWLFQQTGPVHQKLPLILAVDLN